VNGVLSETLTDVSGARLAVLAIESERAAVPSGTAARLKCFHCGEPCRDDVFAKGEKAFCCQGCRVVHDLLAESGLEQFYDLTRHPGVQIRRPAPAGQWAFLDEPVMRRRLLDFADEAQSRVTLHVPAIHCVACVWLLENLFCLHPGIERSQVNFPKREVAISFATRKLKLSELVALLSSIGYGPSLTFGELEKSVAHPVQKRQWLQIGIAGFAFGNIMLFSIPQYFGLDSFSGPGLKTLFGWLSLALALPVVVYSALDYWKSAWLSIRQRVATLDVPIALGLATIYGQSIYEVVSRTGEGYCDSLSGLIFFLLCGRAFQQKTQERMAFDRDYKSFFPLSVVRKRARPIPGTDDDGAQCVPLRPVEERVSLAQLEIGDRIVIRNGEIIPADAKLVSGPAFVDYSFVTGESEPVARAAGDYLFAGGQQIGPAIELETVKAVSQSYLASLWNHEAFQKNDDDSLNTLANRFSRRFIWIVIGIALASLAFWSLKGEGARGFKGFISVLIVACPCALALAAPVTLGTAQRWLAKANVFIKNVFVLERMARVDAIVFDKTGTLTSAGINAVRFENASLPSRPAASFGQVSLSTIEQGWIYSLTRHSTHPHSARINESLGDKHLADTVYDFRETIGCGIEGRIGSHEIWLGSRAWFESRGIACGPRAEESRNPEFSHVGSCVHIAIDHAYRGAFVLSSTLRPEVDQLIRRLEREYELVLLSGDNERDRERFSTLFRDDTRMNFNQTPMDKLGFIRRMQESGKTVMMVGDGLNDAGALRQSDVGVAVVEKIGSFSPASDLILDAKRVPELFEIMKLARRATRIVHLGFGVSTAYNVIGVSIAAAGFLSPLVCAVLMPLSSASVVLFACGMTSWAARTLIQDSKSENAHREESEHSDPRPNLHSPISNASLS
jgi:Cu+-exporting ATPase